MPLFLLFKTISVDFHFIQETPPSFVIGYHLSCQPLLPPPGYQLVQGATLFNAQGWYSVEGNGSQPHCVATH